MRRIEAERRWPEGPRQFDAPSTWQEAVEREIQVGEHELAGLAERMLSWPFSFPASRQEETWDSSPGESQATVVREQKAIAGSVEVSAELVADAIYRVRVRVRNDTPFDAMALHDRDDALLSSLVSTHTILSVRDGEFISLIDPGERWRDLADRCQNIQSWPVLVGEAGERDAMLSAPIILYDYPQIAPESPGDLFDSTEIDEILTLRILTMTDQEKRAMAAVDERARALLERTESMGQEQLMGLHGTIRGPCGRIDWRLAMHREDLLRRKTSDPIKSGSPVFYTGCRCACADLAAGCGGISSTWRLGARPASDRLDRAGF